MKTEPKSQNRIKRGEVSIEFIKTYRRESDVALMNLLESCNSQERTVAGILLGERKCISAIDSLCNALRTENALYSRIAICDALAELGHPAIARLIGLLGKIGDNQHNKLPEKGFYKKSYPLPRDIAARTLVRMAPPVLSVLEPQLGEMERYQKLEAIDVIGHISFYYKTARSLPYLLNLYYENQQDMLIQWKILRAFQSFSKQEVTDLLIQVLQQQSEPALRWEAVRSLGLQKRKINPQIIENLRIDSDAEIRQMMNLFF